MSLEKPELKKDKHELYQQIKDEWKKISFNEEEFVEIFDKKFKDPEQLIPLFNNQGVPITDGENQRVLLTLDKIDNSDKREHMMGLIKQIDQSVNFVERLSSEKEILDFMEQNGNNLRELIQKYLE